MRKLEVLNAYRKAADKFIKKVENGHAQSVETYNDFKQVVELHNRLNKPVKKPFNKLIKFLEN